MYSRSQNRRDPTLRVPENYSGCAFSENKNADLPPRFLEVAKPTQEKESVLFPPPPPPPPVEKHLEREKQRTQALLPIKKGGFSFAGGLDFDQLLILGLILLLSRGEEGNDIVLWLALLLLCG